MKTDKSLEKLAKAILIAHWLERGENMSTIRELRTTLIDPLASLDLALPTKYGSCTKLLKLIHSGILEKGIIQVAEALDQNSDSSSKSSETATRYLLEDLMTDFGVKK